MIKNKKKTYIAYGSDMQPYFLEVTIEDDAVVKISSAPTVAERTGEDQWRFEFNFNTASGKKKLVLSFCEMDEIARVLRLWKDSESGWFSPWETLGEIRKI